MLAISARNQIIVGLLMAACVALTRGHHVAGLTDMPDASWAALFLAGMYLRPRWVFAALIAEMAILDFAAVTWGSVDSFCMTGAYGMLLPAYGALWLAGRWYARCYREHVATVFPLGMSLCVGLSACELFSSGGFYFLSGRFADTSLGEFVERFAEYFPASVGSFLPYIAFAALLHIGSVMLRNSASVTRRSRAAIH
jgi:hypothetical protein